jgi:hypothetical protein
MQNKSHTSTSLAGSDSSRTSFRDTINQSDQTRLEDGAPRIIAYEFIDSGELARRWGLPVSWVRDQVRGRAQDPLPHVNFGKYVRFLWGSDGLELWIRRRIVVGNNRRLGRTR